MSLLFNKVIEILAIAIRQGKKKGIQIRKKEVKQCLFANDMILHNEDPKDSKRKKKNFITNKFSTVAGYKKSINRTQLYFYT